MIEPTAKKLQLNTFRAGDTTKTEQGGVYGIEDKVEISRLEVKRDFSSPEATFETFKQAILAQDLSTFQASLDPKGEGEIGKCATDPKAASDGMKELLDCVSKGDPYELGQLSDQRVRKNYKYERYTYKGSQKGNFFRDTTLRCPEGVGCDACWKIYNITEVSFGSQGLQVSTKSKKLLVANL